jgi:hypothetical protein
MWWRFCTLAVSLVGLLVPRAALAQLPNFGSWSTSANGTGSAAYLPFSYSQAQSGVGIPNGNVGTSSSNALYHAELLSQAVVSAPFQQAMEDQPQPVTLQTLTIASKTLSNFPFSSGAHTFVSFTVTEPITMIMTAPPGNIQSPTGPFTVSGPAGFSWPAYQGAYFKLSTYHLLPVGDYTFTGNVPTGPLDAESKGMVLYFVVPEPGTDVILLVSSFMLIATRPGRSKSC